MPHLVSTLHHQAKDYWIGFEVGKGDGLNAVYGIDDSCDPGITSNHVTNFTECAKGYDVGWETTCAIGVAKFGTA